MPSRRTARVCRGAEPDPVVVWPRLLTGVWRRPSFRIAPLEVAHARDIARLHGAGGFSRGWDTNECAALLAERTVVADGVFQGQGIQGHRDQVGGFILLRCAGDEAEVLSIVIDPASRRQGQAKALLGASIARLALQGTRSIFLEVAESNSAAIGLYRALDFREVGQRHGYYPMAGGARATALVMRRDLP
jgi:[ribosomal protein S18]-alanine N-acetyltransferase